MIASFDFAFYIMHVIACNCKFGFLTASIALAVLEITLMMMMMAQNIS